jgi:hypothetical protein
MRRCWTCRVALSSSESYRANGRYGHASKPCSSCGFQTCELCPQHDEDACLRERLERRLPAPGLMDEEHRRLILKWRWRYSAADIAEAFGLPELAVRLAWREDCRGSYDIRPLRKFARWSQAEERYIREAYLAGATLADICRRLGRGRVSVTRRIDAMGLTRIQQGLRIQRIRLAWERRNVHRF